MISEKMIEKFNEQIQHELFSGHLYLSMAAYCSSIDLDGFGNFFIIQEKEERDHAMKLYHYVNEQGGRVKIYGLEQPTVDFKSLADVFEQAWEHEKGVTRRLNAIMDLAVEEKDYATQGLLQWFIDEQIEEEATMLTILREVRLVGDNGQGLLMLDREKAQRTYTPLTQ